ncbi:hypothetical protein O1M54_50215 [Streptomyces diastatochromogenes]|nr:hypothetical protein [Streptomyces diastatochromogenes]
MTEKIGQVRAELARQHDVAVSTDHAGSRRNQMFINKIFSTTDVSNGRRQQSR